MPREVPEWIGRTDNTAIPPRVKIRIFLLANGKCANCERFIAGKLTAEYDHMTALINGGQHRESNLQLLCCECHGMKTAADVAEKSRVNRRIAAHLGIKPKNGRPMPGTKRSGIRKRMNGTVERRT